MCRDLLRCSRLLLLLAMAAGLGACEVLPLAGPDARAWHDSETAADQFRVFRAVMASPRRAPVWADRLQHLSTQASPSRLWSVVRELSARDRDTGLADRATSAGEAALDAPTREALQALPPALRDAVHAQLHAMQIAQLDLAYALRALPADLSRDALLRPDVDVRMLARLAPRVDLPALGRAMQGVIDATAQLRLALQQLSDARALPPLVWRHLTPRGWVHLDTTGQSRRQTPEDVWLWVKVGGDDAYDLDAFAGPSSVASPAVRVLLDTGGHDRYQASRDGGDAASGVLGLALLWDGGGDDQWRCRSWCQAAALLGAAAPVNEGAGRDTLQADTQAQAHAVGGLALLAGNPGALTLQASAATAYHALSDAQGSAGPSGVALLADLHGDDHYELAAQPVVAPSSQLPGRNRSMGQGAGRGWRLTQASDAASRAHPEPVRETAGGVGVLIDLQGDDHYQAQVFAQGAGYQEGLGMLIDAAGHNRHEVAWYGLGAAAHGAAGVFLASGAGDDDYRVSHVTSLGAGHDFSLGWFEDRGGNDRYALGDFGMGLSSDRGIGVFIDTQGCNRLQIDAVPARGMGQRHRLQPVQAPATPPWAEGQAVFRVARNRAAESDGHCRNTR